MPLRETTRSLQGVWITAIVAAVLQVALSPQISILNGTVNFMMVLSITLALTAEPGTAVIIGFASGLFFDLTSSAPVGLMSLILSVASFLAASSAHGAMGGVTRESMRLVGIALLVTNLLYGLCLFFMGVQGDLIWALLGHGLSSTVLDFLVALIFMAIGGGSSSQRGFSTRGGASRYKMPR